MDKKSFKRSGRKCLICNEDDYDILDVHRIKFGKEYKYWNTTILCANCHRKVHSGKIIIEGKYMSSVGPIIHYFIDGKEYWKK